MFALALGPTRPKKQGQEKQSTIRCDSKYTLTSFGGAGGQVCCLIADTLGIKTIFLHPYAVLPFFYLSL